MFSSSVSIQHASHPLMLTRRSICTFALSYRGLKKTKKQNKQIKNPPRMHLYLLFQCL